LLFQFHPSLICSFFKFCSSYFYYYLFCLKSFFKLLLFTISPFFFIRFDPHSFDCPFFCFGKFLKLIFLNWFVIHFLIEPRFSVSQFVGFKNLTKFRMFSLVHLVFFPLSKLFVFLISSFSIYSIGDWVFFSLLSVEFLVGLENDSIISDLSVEFLFFIIYLNLFILILSFNIWYIENWSSCFFSFPFKWFFFCFFFMRLSQSYVYCHGIRELTRFNYFFVTFF
jgi:hypothetical protein